MCVPACLCVDVQVHARRHAHRRRHSRFSQRQPVDQLHASERARRVRAAAAPAAEGAPRRGERAGDRWGRRGGEGRTEMAALYSDDVRGNELISMRKSGRNLVREATTLAPREGRTAMKDKAKSVSICAPRTPLGRTEGRDQEAQMDRCRAFTSVRRPRGGRASRLRPPIVAHRPGHPAPAEGRRIER